MRLRWTPKRSACSWCFAGPLPSRIGPKRSPSDCGNTPTRLPKIIPAKVPCWICTMVFINICCAFGKIPAQRNMMKLPIRRIGLDSNGLDQTTTWPLLVIPLERPCPLCLGCLLPRTRGSREMGRSRYSPLVVRTLGGTILRMPFVIKRRPGRSCTLDFTITTMRSRTFQQILVLQR